VHLIKIDNVTPKVTPAFEDIRGEVQTDWSEQAQRAANQEALKDLIQKYKVDVLDETENTIAK